VRTVCLEGPSASGKTTLAAALARECGALVVPELDARGAPPIAESAAWFVDRHAERWQLAQRSGASAPFAVLDGDPFKGLWYNWVYAADGWPGPDVVAPLYRPHLRRRTIAFPDLYVVLDASEAQLRQRRAGDVTRSRRGFETHLRLVAPLRRYFAALREAAPARVAVLGSTAQAEPVSRVLEALRRLPPGPPDSVGLFEYMVEWVRTHSPAASGPGA
jgi:hypothetical protein